MSVLKRFSKDPNSEMTFVDHLESLRWHLIRSAIVILVLVVVGFFNIEWIYSHIVMGPTKNDFPSYKFLCWLGNKYNIKGMCLDSIKIDFQNFKLSGQFMMSFTSAGLFGLIAGMPYLFWEAWRFIRPALSPYEIKQSTGIVFWVSVLFAFGIAFGYYIIAPYTVQFFASYQLDASIKNIITIDDYLDTISSLTIGTGLVFELPVIIYFLSKIGIMTPTFMKNTRRYAIVIILMLAAVITPPDVVSMIIVTIPIVLLYEISIGISARVEKDRLKKEKEFFNN